MVRIVQPLTGSVFQAPAEIKITALVRDPDGWVGFVEFFANDRKIGEQHIVFISGAASRRITDFLSGLEPGAGR